MFSQFFKRCLAVAAVFVFSVAPLLADDGAPEAQDWVLSYGIMLGFLALTIVILLRPLHRSDSAFSFDELQAQKEEDLKKMLKG